MMATAAVQRKVAVVGGGITGACVASTLARLSSVNNNDDTIIHVFDQGRSGVGGRTSHRRVSSSTTDDDLRWDHGCQFFRADTPQFQEVIKEWMDKKIAVEWEGNFVGEPGGADFFGLPTQPPFYVGVGGIKSISHNLLHETSERIHVFEGQRVAGMTHDDFDKTWKLFGTSGEAAYHDSDESVAKAVSPELIGEGYDAVIMTDISSSFSSWHRASAGVPEDFADRVRTKAGARVPLFTCMIAFETNMPVDISAATLNDPSLWFAARSNAKPGLENCLTQDCWTLVSTPEYAMQAIEETPMQDPKTGEFIPQPPDYLTSVPGPELEAAFRRIVKEGRLGKVEGDLPKTAYLNAQRWGSALPAHRHLDESSPTRKIISGVAYDSGRASLAPTTKQGASADNFVADEGRMLFQAGDMVSNYSPGFEGAALSGIDAAHHIYELLNRSP